MDRSIWFEISMGNAGNALDGELVSGPGEEVDTTHHDDESKRLLRC